MQSHIRLKLAEKIAEAIKNGEEKPLEVRVL